DRIVSGPCRALAHRPLRHRASNGCREHAPHHPCDVTASRPRSPDRPGAGRRRAGRLAPTPETRGLGRGRRGATWSQVWRRRRPSATARVHGGRMSRSVVLTFLLTASLARADEIAPSGLGSRTVRFTYQAKVTAPDGANALDLWLPLPREDDQSILDLR